MTEAAMPGLPAHSFASAMLPAVSASPLPGVSAEWAFAGSAGAGVRVAVVDSGVETGHPDLGHCVDAGAGAYVDVAGTGCEVVAGPHDDAVGHGTACAGIVHALAPDAVVVSVRVVVPGSAAGAEPLVCGLEWAVAQGFDIVNVSLGTHRAEAAARLREICDDAYFNGTLVVTAASNSGRTSYPSMFASVASTACNTATDPMRFHYNPSPPTEFLARGVGVDVAWRRGARATGTGNSYAAAHLSGLAALVRSKHPTMDALTLKSVLRATAVNIRTAAELPGRVSRGRTTLHGRLTG